MCLTPASYKTVWKAAINHRYTSQKVGIRFGETFKQYVAAGRSLDALTAIPLAIAGCLRYLLGVDDYENEMQLAGIRWDDPASYTGQLESILSDEGIFGLNLTETSLAPHIEADFTSMLLGKGAVRKTLRQSLSGNGTKQ